MASFQRVALFILFDSLENDLVGHIRTIGQQEAILNPTEREKAARRVTSDHERSLDVNNDYDLLYGLDLGDKFSVLLRLKKDMAPDQQKYFSALQGSVERVISARNDVMHGRPLTINQQVIALSFAQGLLKHSAYWPVLRHAYTEYTDNPGAFLARSVLFLDEPASTRVLHNLPVPDHDATGFLARPDLERDLKRKILGRNPVVSILGDGGNGKTALALQVLHNLVRSNDHEFELIIWTTAKTSELTPTGIVELESKSREALAIMTEAAFLEVSSGTPQERLTRLLQENTVLLVIDNFETVIGSEILDLAQDVPGKSKLLFTSRHPVGGDLTVVVGELSPHDAMVYFRRLVDVFSVDGLKKFSESTVSRWLTSLSFKPLLIKWLVLGAKSGLDPNAIVANKDLALKYCLDNVILSIGPEAQAVIVVLTTLPSAAASSVIQSVSQLTAEKVNDGLAELNRYGLIEAHVSDDGSQQFLIRSFARTYVQRLIKVEPRLIDRILDNNRRIESQYQAERQISQRRRNSYRNFVIRNRSEMIVADLLRSAWHYSSIGELDTANEKLGQAKALEPGYFEIHHTEAFIALEQNDWNRAISAFENALSLDAGQPQIHLGLAGTLMRLLENKRAAEHYDLALALDEDAHALREAARNQYIIGDFTRAQSYLDRAFQIPDLQHLDLIKLFDVQMQLFIRHADNLSVAGDDAGALISLEKCEKFLHGLRERDIDNRMIFHALKARPLVQRLHRNGVDSEVLKEFVGRLNKYSSFGEEPELDLISGVSEKHMGRLKPEGRKPDYGFLSSDTVEDSFLHITRVPSEIWEWLVAFGRVSFDSDIDESGRRYASNVAIAEGDN